MKCSKEGNPVRPLSVVARQLDRGFDRLRSEVTVINFVRARKGRDLRQPLRQRDHVLVIKICSRHVDQLARLLLNGCDHIGMAMAGGDHCYAGAEVKKLVSVYIGDYNSTAAVCDQGI